MLKFSVSYSLRFLLVIGYWQKMLGFSAKFHFYFFVNYGFDAPLQLLLHGCIIKEPLEILMRIEHGGSVASGS